MLETRLANLAGALPIFGAYATESLMQWSALTINRFIISMPDKAQVVRRLQAQQVYESTSTRLTPHCSILDEVPSNCITTIPCKETDMKLQVAKVQIPKTLVQLSEYLMPVESCICCKGRS